MTTRLLPTFLVLVFLLCAATAWAQPGGDPDLPAEEVDIIKSFDARLGDANRFQLDPSLPPLDTATRRLDYRVFSKTLPVEYLPPKIRPLAMRREKMEEGYDGYVKLGGGFPASFLGQGFYHLGNDETFSLDLFADHHSANNSQNVENQRFSWTTGGVDGTYYFDQGFAVNTKLAYTSDAVFYYGYNEVAEALEETISFDKEEVRQRFGIFDAEASIYNSARTEADFNYHAGFKAYLMNDSYSASRENGFDLRIGGTKWFDDTHPLSIELQTDFTGYDDTEGDQDLNNFFLRPNFTYHAERFRAKVGLNLASNNDIFTFFPDIEVTAVLVEGVVNAYVGTDGTLQKNNFRNLANYNPFISSPLRIRNSLYYRYYGGVKGHVEGIDYDFQASYKAIDDLATFRLLDPFSETPRFDVVYDDGSIITIKGSLTAPLFEGFEIIGAFSQNIYDLDNEEKPWHLPALTVNVGGRYTTLENKLTVRGDFFLENGVPFVNAEGEADNLNALFDVSLGAEYYFSERFGGFVQLNNLANNRRERWFRYPTFGINALAGIMVRF
ncbi:hypothetical protein [Phaeodactylibacter luteus]|uniref:TonB-dependent receptor n=1 Tax=Phaeodactylibacter luteus TaxID=1564516 RepID=A0A5C6RHL7_9BACT|nr:hypothetical protein [Phaeodactylibacter luteus]TXB61593.1 hypothetical protein FRY97_18350 [Phaeodactylibacter luteus]